MANGDTQTLDILQDGTVGAGAIGTSGFGAPRTYRRVENGVIINTIKFDITGLACVGTAENDVIGLSAGGVAYIGRHTIANYGIIFKATMSCLESPAEATATYTQDIDIVANSSALLVYDGAAGSSKVINGATMLIGQSVVNWVPAITTDDYFYIVEGDTAATTGVYSAGQYVLTLYGHAALA